METGLSTTGAFMRKLPAIPTILSASLGILIGLSPNIFSIDPIRITVFLMFSLALGLPVIWVSVIYPIPDFLYKSWMNRNAILIEQAYQLRYLLLVSLGFCCGILIFSFELALVFSLVFGIHFYSTSLIFRTIGIESLPYRTGKKGNRFRSLAKETGAVVLPIGTIPTQLRTVVAALFNTGIVLVAGVSESHRFYILFLLFLISVVVYVKKNALVFFVQNHAFFEEYFVPSKQSEQPKLLEKEALYWVPALHKTNVRFLLSMHQRRSTFSRFILLFFFVILIFVMTKFATVWLHVSFLCLFVIWIIESLLLLHSSFGTFSFWMLPQSFIKLLAVHFFAQIRWYPLLLVSIWLILPAQPFLSWLIIGTCVVLLQLVLSSVAVAITFKTKRKNYG